MMYRHFVLPSRYSKWQNIKLSFLLERNFTHYERAMAAVLADQTADRSRTLYFCYVAPVMATLFNLYNGDIPAHAVLQGSIDYLQDNANRNPVAAELLLEFVEVAKKAGIDVRTVRYKDNS